jgi:hypothetical protein
VNEDDGRFFITVEIVGYFFSLILDELHLQNIWKQKSGRGFLPERGKDSRIGKGSKTF